MFSHFITVGIVILFPCQCLAQVTLFQRSTEVRLGVGNSMELACSVTGAIDSSRGWTGGPGFSTLITDGVSTDTSKYTESLQTIDFSLHIHNVVVDDVCGVDYRCSNGFYTSQIETIVLNSSIFSYVPTSPEIKVQSEVYDTDKKMTILVNLTKVFPEPTCTAKLGNKDVTFLSNSYNNGNCGLKSTELSINNETYDCSGSLLIKCTVGSNLFTVYDVTPSSCTTTSPTTTPIPTTTTPSTSPNKCFFYEEKSCVVNKIFLALIVVSVSLFLLGCFIKWKRNQRHQDNSSDSDKEKKENNPDKQELHEK